jgi:hypothetical protein
MTETYISADTEMSAMSVSAEKTLHTETDTEILKVVADLTVVNNTVQFRKLNLCYSLIPEINKNFLQSKLIKIN